MQVAIKEQRKDADQQDAHRIIMGSMSQLDMRLHSLESQGARSDRRVAELASLAQALTEEQRANILRLDRLEEYARCSQGQSSSFYSNSSARDRSSQAASGSEETQRRLCNVERETHTISTNLKLIVSSVEEAQARQNHRLQILEDFVTATNHQRSASTLGAPRSFPGSLAADSLAARAISVALPNDKLRLELSAAELRASESLRAAQELLRRCECGPSPRDTAASSPRRRSPNRDQDDFGIDDLRRRLDRVSGYETPPSSEGRDKFARGGGRRAGAAQLEETQASRATNQAFQEHRGAIQELYMRVGDLGQNLGPRADAVEARLQALAETVEELCQRRGVYGAGPGNIELRMQSLTQLVEEMRARFDKVVAGEQKLSLTLPTHDELRVLSRRMDEVARSASVKEASILELQSRMANIPTTDQIQHVTSLLQGQKSLTADVEDLRSKFADMTQDRLEMDSEQQNQREKIKSLQVKLEKFSSEMKSITTSHAESTAVLHTHVSDLLTSRAQSTDAISELRIQLSTPKDCGEQLTSRDDSAATHPRIEEMSARMQSLSMQIESMTASHAESISDLASSRAQSAETMAEMRLQLDAIADLRTQLETRQRTREQGVFEPTTNLQLERCEALGARLESLARDVQMIGASNADASAAMHARITELSAARTEHSESISDLQTRCKTLQSLEQVVEERSKAQLVLHSEREKRLEARLEEILSAHLKEYLSPASEDVVPLGGNELLRLNADWDMAAENMAVQTSELTAACSNLQQKYETLHDIVDGRISVSLQTLESQLPEALQKVERLIVEQSDRFGKVEENDVRLNLTQTRLGVCEEKVTNCMGLLEKVPTVSQMRMHWQEDVHRLLHELNADGLQKRMDLSIDAIEELNAQQQRTMLQVRSLMQLFDEDAFYKSDVVVPSDCGEKIVEVDQTIVQPYAVNLNTRDATTTSVDVISGETS